MQQQLEPLHVFFVCTSCFTLICISPVIVRAKMKEVCNMENNKHQNIDEANSNLNITGAICNHSPPLTAALS